MKGKSLSRVRLLATPWTTAYQAPPSMGFSRQEYWSGVPLPSLISDCYKQLYANKMDNLEKMDKSLERYSLPKLNQEEIENVNRPNTSTDTETVILKLPTGTPWWSSG